MLTRYRIHHLTIVLTFPHSWMDFHLFELIPNSVKYILTKQDISTEKGPFLGPVDDSSPITIKPYLLISYLSPSHSTKLFRIISLYLILCGTTMKSSLFSFSLFVCFLNIVEGKVGENCYLDALEMNYSETGGRQKWHYILFSDQLCLGRQQVGVWVWGWASQVKLLWCLVSHRNHFWVIWSVATWPTFLINLPSKMAIFTKV